MDTKTKDADTEQNSHVLSRASLECNKCGTGENYSTFLCFVGSYKV